ncbi:hypothetical protein NXV73_13445 [Bacteroides salyersiae]|nr:hypothetical protein [Bacteroides salyersiae]
MGVIRGFSQYQREFDSPYVTLTRRGYKTEYKTQINSNLKVTQDLDFWDWSKGFTAHALIAFDVRANQQLNYKVDDSHGSQLEEKMVMFG